MTAWLNFPVNQYAKIINLSCMIFQPCYATQFEMYLVDAAHWCNRNIINIRSLLH